MMNYLRLLAMRISERNQCPRKSIGIERMALSEGVDYMSFVYLFGIFALGAYLLQILLG